MADKNNKMTWVMLRQQLANRAGVSKQEAERFLNGMIDATIQALQDERQIKINNLGQFRLQTVAPRRSVNVATGEHIQLEEHNKITFTPEISLKEELSGTATPKLSPDTDPLKKLSDQADEITDILADMGIGPKVNVSVQNETIVKEEDSTTEPSQPVAVPANPEPMIAQEEQEEATPIPQQEEPQSPNAIEIPTKAEDQQEPEKQEQQKESAHEEKHKQNKKRPFRPWLTAALTILVFCILLIITYFFLQHKIVNWAETLRQKVGEPTVINSNPEPFSSVDTLIVPQDTLLEKPNADSITSTPTDIFNPDAERDYSELITTEEMHADSRLSWMAYRYYGSKDLWVLLFEANKDHITDPSHITIGTPIRVPKLSAELKDVNNPQTRALLDTLQKRYLQ